MDIFVTSGEGRGSTLLSAFDAALQDANVHNYNLIQLSSIIPPNSRVKVQKFKENTDEYGHKLYVVKAEKRSREAGKYLGAAIGWYQYGDGRGVFVEHEEIGETKEAVESSLMDSVDKSIIDLCKVRNVKFHKSKMRTKLSIVEVKDSAASCSLVVAVYQAEGWK
jgi:arginine decarboxylase